jgi:hypothetical protein
MGTYAISTARTITVVAKFVKLAKGLTRVLFKVVRAAKGFVFVEMATPAATEEVINRFDGYPLDNRLIVVNVALTP